MSVTLHAPRTPSPTATAPGGLPRSTTGRRLVAGAVLAGAALNTAEAVLAQLLPPRPEDLRDQLAGVAEHTALYGTRAVIGTLAVPLLAVAFVATARLLAPRARRTAIAAGSLLLAGMWGFLGVHVVGLLQLPASATGDLDAAARVLASFEASPVLGGLFLLPFLAGTVLGMLVLTVGLLVTGALPRWIPAAWLVFILVDFSVGAVGPVDPHWLFLAGATGIAAHLLRAPDATRTDDAVARNA